MKKKRVTEQLWDKRLAWLVCVTPSQPVADECENHKINAGLVFVSIKKTAADVAELNMLLM